jgi:KipI family sensor histidine kinase inhibitor
MLGFTPGFAYIGGLDKALNVPRRKQPRLHVAAGSIGIADGRTGVYALAGPGGWQIIGRTARSLFDPSSEQPFQLLPNTRVRFKAIKEDEFAAIHKQLVQLITKKP